MKQVMIDAGAIVTDKQTTLENYATYITSGRLILFAQLLEDGIPVGKRIHVCTRQTGEILTLPVNTNQQLLISCTTDPETSLLQLPLTDFARVAKGNTLQEAEESWLSECGPMDTFFDALHTQCTEENKQFSRQYTKQQESESAQNEQLITKLASVIDIKEQQDKDECCDTAVTQALRSVATHTGITLPEDLIVDHESIVTPVDQVGMQGKFRTRKIRFLKDWWNTNSGHIFTYTKDGLPVSLRHSKKGYVATTFADDSPSITTFVSREFATTLSSDGWTFYRPFPARVLKLTDLLSFAFKGNYLDLGTILLVTVILSLVNLLIPYATGALVDSVIPQANQHRLFLLAMMLLAAAFSQAMLGAATSFAQLRIETRAGYATLAAFLDRVLSLPAPFFRSYSSGDLAQRIMGIETIRRTLSSATITPILKAVYSISYLGMIFYYSTTLALWAIGFVVLLILFILCSSIIQMHYQKTIQKTSGELDGLLQQLFTSIEKIRIASAETRMFSRWASLFQTKRVAQFRAVITNNALLTFNAGITSISTIVVYYVYVNNVLVSQGANGATSTGVFLAFSAAFSGVLTSGVGLAAAITPLLTIMPIYKRVKPIMDEVPEVCETGEMMKLEGKISAKGLSFQYEMAESLTLDNVSIEANPGEFIAIVGPSGSGKSTLLKLLLGMENPSQGDVFFDDVAMSSLDARFVRRQIGTVMQDTRIMSSSIMQMLIGTSTLTLDDAWEAAKTVGFDKDIEAMPMQMFTIVQEGTISGGQKQRIMIARAIIHKPRLLLLDEATSALDQISQEHVTKSINDLHCTRIVIAHRLSTIMHADTIYVLDQGKIIEQGKFDELLALDGVFAELSKRQMTTAEVGPA